MIISLTTIPQRITYIKPVIDSLKKQTKKPSKILIWIPEEYIDKWGKTHTYNIPDFLTQESIVEIKRCKDYGPATKYLHAINTLPKDEEFIVVDDDTIYSEYMIENLTSFPEIDAPKAIKGVHFENGERKNRKIKLNVHKNAKRTLGLATIICGCDGYILKPKFFNNSIYNIQEKFKRCDDLWLSAFLETHNIKRYVVPCMELSQNTYDFIITELYKNRPERPPRWRDKPPHPHVRYTDHVYAINGGKYETEDIFTEIVKTFRHEG